LPCPRGRGTLEGPLRAGSSQEPPPPPRQWRQPGRTTAPPPWQLPRLLLTSRVGTRPRLPLQTGAGARSQPTPCRPENLRETPSSALDAAEGAEPPTSLTWPRTGCSDAMASSVSTMLGEVPSSARATATNVVASGISASKIDGSANTYSVTASRISPIVSRELSGVKVYDPC
jgi:hypothetical protein